MPPPRRQCGPAPTVGDRSGMADSLSTVIIKLGRLTERRLQRGLQSVGLSAGQFVVLAYVGRCPGASRAGIARDVQVSPQAVGGLTTQLLDAGLLQREAGAPGSASSFTITEHGIDVLEAATPVVEDLTYEILALIRPDLAALLDGASRHVLTRMSC